MAVFSRPGSQCLEGECNFATFYLDDLEFALDVSYIESAITLPDHIVALPNSSEFISGMIDLRDRIVPVIDTRKRFGMVPAQERDRLLLAVIQCRGRYMGLTFDRLNEVLRVKDASLERLAPEFQVENDLLSSVIKIDGGRRLIQVIDPEALVQYVSLPEHDAGEDEERHGGSRAWQQQRVVVVRIDSQLFGIPVEKVREIMVVPEISQRLVVEEYILGVITLREELVSVIDFRVYLGAGPGPRTRESRVVILEAGGIRFGILVDAVREVHSYEENERQAMPTWSGNRHDGGFSGVLVREGGQIVLVDLERLLHEALKRVSAHASLHRKDASSSSCLRGRESGEGERLETSQATYITFEIDDIYGVKVENVREIIQNRNSVRPMPGQLDFVQGLLNLRSEVVPVINLRKFCGGESARDEERLIMIFTHADRQIGMLVDRLLEIKTVEENGQAHMHHLMNHRASELDRGVVDRVVNFQNREGRQVPTKIIDIPKFIETMRSGPPG